MAIQDDVKANILALLNADDLDLNGETTIFGMVIKEQLIDFGISIGYTYINEVVGSDDITDADYKNKIVACLTDMTMLRVWATLAGISIPTHFNFKIGDNTISKNVHPMNEMNLKMYAESVEKWIKILLKTLEYVLGHDMKMRFVPFYSGKNRFRLQLLWKISSQKNMLKNETRGNIFSTNISIDTAKEREWSRIEV